MTRLSKAGWSWGCVSAVDSCGRTILVVDAHRGDGKRFVVCAGTFTLCLALSRLRGLARRRHLDLRFLVAIHAQ